MINKLQATFMTLANFISLVCAYVRLNLHAQLEYRGAFISQAAAMFINDCFWVIFWTLFFERFPTLHGWTSRDVITLWAIASAGFGLAHSVCGNARLLPVLIARGQLDAWMLYPRALLPHLLVGKMSASAVGDAIFGYVVYLVFVRPDLQHLALFVLLTFAVAMLFTGFGIFTGSLGFYLGNAEVLAEQWEFAMITFSVYPATLFQGAERIFLCTVIPAFFVSYFPIVALRQMSFVHAGIAFAGAFVVLALGVSAFYYGLRRYESGNLMEMRG